MGGIILSASFGGGTGGELRSERRPRHLERLFERLGPGTGVVLGFLLIVVIGGLVSPYFLTQRNITNVLLQTAMLGAVAGVPLNAADLYATLTGCAPAGQVSQGRDLGNDWRIVHVSAGQVSYELYLHRDTPALPWRLVATMREGATDAVVRVEYRDFQNGLPRAIHIKGLEQEAFDLTLALSQVETNVPLGDDVFRIEIPPSAVPITVDELRRARLGLREN